MKKVIFLDVDGVLNYQGLWKNRFSRDNAVEDNTIRLSWRCLKLLRKLVDKTGAELVLSSTWRKVDSHQKLLSKYLSAFNMVLIDKTGSDKDGIRGREIKEWLKKNPVDRFVILDDDSDVENLSQFLVQTSYFKGGLKRKHIRKAIKILNRRDK